MRRKGVPYRKFGERLEEGVKRLAIARRQLVGQTHERLAEQELSVAASTLYSWRRGEHLPEPALIERLARTFAREWGADLAWVAEFLDAADYGPLRAVEELNRDLFGDVGRGEVRRGARDWTQAAFEGLRAAGCLTQADWLRLVGGVGLWLVGWWLVGPFYAWPYPDTRTAMTVCVAYAFASLGLPLGICLLSGLGRAATGRSERWKLWGLRCAVAYVAYHLAMAVFLAVAILLYAAGVWPLPAALGPLALALAIIFAYALARQFPATRVDGQGRLRFYPSVDILVLVTFVALGPLVAAFFAFLAGPWLADRYRSGLILLAAVMLAVVSVKREKKTSR